MVSIPIPRRKGPGMGTVVLSVIGGAVCLLAVL